MKNYLTIANAALPGSLIWTAVDMVSGAAYEYPDKVSVKMGGKTS